MIDCKDLPGLDLEEWPPEPEQEHFEPVRVIDLDHRIRDFEEDAEVDGQSGLKLEDPVEEIWNT